MAISGLAPDPDVKLIAMNRPVESRSAERLYTTPITSQLVDQRLEHQVTDEAAAPVAAHQHRHRRRGLLRRLLNRA